MADAFVIIQIGDLDLDAVYADTIAPAIRSAGLEPRRIDEDNEGGLLVAEILSAIDPPVPAQTPDQRA